MSKKSLKSKGDRNLTGVRGMVAYYVTQNAGITGVLTKDCLIRNYAV